VRSGAGGSVGERSDNLGELKNAPGVHVVDGAALPNMAARNPNLTIMANVDRIGTTLATAWRK
jgi:choline dehydrogenase-like flavoprotein